MTGRFRKLLTASQKNDLLQNEVVLRYLEARKEATGEAGIAEEANGEEDFS